MQRQRKSCTYFLEAEKRAAAVVLDDLRHAQFDGLIGGKALVACRAAAAAADAVARIADTGVYNLGVRRFTEWTMHGLRRGAR